MGLQLCSAAPGFSVGAADLTKVFRFPRRALQPLSHSLTPHEDLSGRKQFFSFSLVVTAMEMCGKREYLKALAGDSNAKRQAWGPGVAFISSDP